ncbi:MAG TPA: amino acid adenylation domain-containing protein, partial [Thermoanaerobaculia bacterium]|nr:amino acid adenylation domain-containing protein [Thermoanaerobaculia bacterium]
LARRRGGLAPALMPVVFTSTLNLVSQGEALAGLGAGAEWGYAISQTPQVWLDHQVYENQQGLSYTWDVVEGLFPPETVMDMMASYQALLAGLAAEEAPWEAARPVLPPARQLALFAAANATAGAVPEGLLHAPFAAMAASDPERVAVIAGGVTLTYGELARRANALARRLRGLGARPNTLVAVVMEKGWEQVVGVLAVLASGAAYLPIDPELPRARRFFLFANGGVEIALTQPHLAASLEWPPEVRHLAVSRNSPGPEEDGSPLAAVQGPHDLAYVIYTSGSTGNPKGVMTDHRGALNTVVDVDERFGVGPRDRVLALSSLSFDLSVYDVFGLLAAGGAVVLPEAERSRDPQHWAELIDRHGVTVWNTVPALLEMLVDYGEVTGYGAPSLRLVLLSGDWISLRLPERIRKVSPHAEVVSLGGATEASIWSILFPIAEVDPAWRSIPYGRAMRNQTFHVLDKDLLPRPVGVPGQLYIGGIGLAQGYWGDEEKTARSFLVDPRAGERLYRTGDLGRYLADGTIEFLGREDFQVKVGGFRIELGEIEAALTRHPAVREALVVASAGQAGDRGSRRLAAYLVAPGGAPPVEELRTFLGEQLPAYMVPADFVVLDAFPLTANGKVDRKALPSPLGDGAAAGDSYVAPGGPVEELLAEIWSEVLGIEQVGVRDDFFALGGQSLLATQVISRVRRALAVEVPLRLLFERPTIAALAAEIQRSLRPQDAADAGAALQQIVPDPENRHLPFPLTDVQQAYLIGRSDVFALGQVSTHGYSEINLRGVDLQRLAAAYRHLIERHDMLRAIVHPDGRQEILASVPPYEIATLDLRGKPESEVAEALAAIRRRMSHQVLPSDVWPLYELRASLLGDDQVRLHLSFDFLIGDAWSLQLLLSELSLVYLGREAELRPLSLSFRDYVLATSAMEDWPVYRQALAYWTERLDDFPPAPDLPLAMNPEAMGTPVFARHSGHLGAESWQRLKERAARGGLTPSGVLLAVFAEVLTVWSKSPRFTINLTLFNRLPLHPEVNELVGDFTSLTLLAVDNSEPAPFGQRAQRIQKQLFEDLDHSALSGIRVLRELARRRGGLAPALMPVVFTSTLNLVSQGEALAGLGAGAEWGYAISQTP